jgi:hypothetical protein
MLSYRELALLNRGTKVKVEASPPSVLQACLLTMEPFQGCKDNELRDSRIALDHLSQRIFACRDRPRLIEALADALLAYEKGRCDSMPGLQRETADIQEALTTLARGSLVYEDAYLSRRLTNRPLTPTRLDKAFKDMESAMEVLTPEHDRGTMQITEVSYKNQLFIAMRDAFTKHGPFDRKFLHRTHFFYSMMTWHSPPYTFFLLNDDMALNRNRPCLISKMLKESQS